MTDLVALKNYLQSDDPALEEAIQKAYSQNQWFIPDFTRQAISSIAEQFLNESRYKNWVGSYEVSDAEPKKVAIVMAGNVPLVGFHDLISVLASGHNAIIKLSDKDAVLSRHITDKWIEFNPALSDRISYTDRLNDFDAVIATGSNNSARYFEYYFKNHPHILRRNKNGVAVLTGNETEKDLKDLSSDIFLYFGLGCRNVSKIYVPPGYDFSVWKNAIHEWEYLIDHNKYKNNLDYNFTIYIINQVPHIQLGHLILKEDDAIASRIGCVHFSYYENMTVLEQELEDRMNEIQCIVSVDPVRNWEHILPGQSQNPALHQYADGVDTMKFLTSLKKRQ